MAHEKDKKRKRKDEDVEKSARKKRAPNDFGPTRVVHRTVDADAEPVIVSGSGIRLPKDCTFKAYRKGGASGSNELLLHSSSHSRLDYTAREVPDGGAAAQKIKHYVAAYDPQENKVEIIPVRHMNVRSSVRAEDAATRDAREKRDLDGLSNKQALGMEFGTRKAKKAIESISQNAVSPRKAGAERETGAASVKSSAGAAAVLDSMASAAASAPTRDDMQAAVDADKPRPKHNPKAKAPEDVYTIDEVIGEPMMVNLKVRPWVETIQGGKSLKHPSSFVANRAQALVERDKIPLLKVLKYVGVLIQWFSALRPSKDGGRSLPPRPKMKEAVPEPDNILEAIKQKFTNGTGGMTKWHVDYLRTHLAVYTLIADGFKTDIADLAQDLRMEIKDLKPYFREVGATVDKVTEAERIRNNLSKAQASAHLMAKLVLPLEFPKQRIVPQVGRRR